MICHKMKRLFSEIEAREKEKTGIPKLKVSYNKVFGYFIEVTNKEIILFERIVSITCNVHSGTLR